MGFEDGVPFFGDARLPSLRRLRGRDSTHHPLPLSRICFVRPGSCGVFPVALAHAAACDLNSWSKSRGAAEVEDAVGELARKEA